MNLTEIKAQLVKPATELIPGGFRPTHAITESWVGRVYLFKANEDIPQDQNGDLMVPLFQLCLEDLPFIPAILADTKALTVFVSQALPVDLMPNGDNWLIREYVKSDEIVIKDLVNENSRLKAFPLRAQPVAADYPVWDGGGIPAEIANRIMKLENSGEITDYYDVTENHYGHKLGGYPSFCQSGVDFGHGFEFVMQIASDEKAGLNIIDSGTIFLAKNPLTGAWKYYCDFY